jgi:hypothetical protein
MIRHDASRLPARHNPHRHVGKCAPRPPARPTRATSERTRSTSDSARGFDSFDDSASTTRSRCKSATPRSTRAPSNANPNARSRNAVRDSEPRAASTLATNSVSSLNCIGLFMPPIVRTKQDVNTEKRQQRAYEGDSYLKRARPRKGGARGARPRPAASSHPRRSQARGASMCATARPQTRIPMGNHTYRSHTPRVRTRARSARLRCPRETRFVPRLRSGLCLVARVPRARCAQLWRWWRLDRGVA